MAWFGDRGLLLAVGDHAFDGWGSDFAISQDTSAWYGKTILIDPETGSAEMFSLGHRNPQGLLIDPDGQIWSTEHGPRAGDELNRIVRNANYGWPLVTFGGGYESLEWPMSDTQFEHTGYELPFYTWMPSIEPSNLIRINGDEFAHWRGDLMVASMKDGALWRLRVRDDRLIYLERIPIGYRIRDLVEDADGRIILWTDEGFIVRLGKVRDGLVFSPCSTCHRTDGGPVHGIGPNLWGIVGRPIGAAEGFAYSDAMQSASGTWTTEALDAFIASPSSFLPGTAMQFAGIPDSTTRVEIIRYLATLQ